MSTTQDRIKVGLDLPTSDRTGLGWSELRDIAMLAEEVGAEGASLAVVYTGAVAPEAMEAHAAVAESNPGAGLLAVTSADRLHRGWGAAQRARRAGIAGSAGVESHVEALLAPLARDARIVTVIDGHPATLGWLGSVRGHRVEPLGVDRFGQSGSLPDLYREHGIGVEAILEACGS